MLDRAKFWDVMRDLAYFSQFSCDQKILVIFVNVIIEQKFLRDGVTSGTAGGLIKLIEIKKRLENFITSII